jgi:cytochrome bd-type quinol oxidase subunit 2
MKLLKFVMFLLYRYYYKSKYERSPYSQSLIVLLILLYFNLLELMLIFNKMGVLHLKQTNVTSKNLLLLALFLLPVLLIIIFKLPPKHLKNLNYDEDKVRNGYILLVIYGILSFFLFIILVAISKIK